MIGTKFLTKLTMILDTKLLEQTIVYVSRRRMGTILLQTPILTTFL